MSFVIVRYTLYRNAGWWGNDGTRFVGPTAERVSEVARSRNCPIHDQEGGYLICGVFCISLALLAMLYTYVPSCYRILYYIILLRTPRM